MTTILITLLLISILYLIFAIKDLKDDVSDIEFRMDILKEICADYEKRIKELENVRQTEVKRRKSADKYSRILETAISKCSVYCNNGWSISKALFIELKKDKKSYPSKEQKLFIQNALNRGYYAICCKGFDHCREIIDKYFNNEI
jgi:hypothetical protein